MQFLVYLTVLMVSVSTILLEVHWLTSPPPESKPAVQATSAPVQGANTENPNASLTPIYPVKPDMAATAQQPAPQTSAQQPAQQSAPQTSEQRLPAPAQQAAAETNANAALPQRSSRETTGVAAREDNAKPATTGATNAPNVGNTPQESATRPEQGTASNRCDVQACASAYKSFRASDCTYQSFEGERRLCTKPPVQPTAREQNQETERRKWSRDVGPPDVDRSVRWRTDDTADQSDLDDDDSGPIVIRRSGPRW
jgi:hypothetical protein